MNLETTLAGLHLKNPLMPASGPLTGDAEKMQAIADMGVGAMVTKTISSGPAEIARPCIVGVQQTVFNTELWSEFGPDVWVNDFLPNTTLLGIPVIVSCGYSAADMALLIPQLDAFADAFEISTHYVGTNLDDIAKTVRTIRHYTQKPVFMKLSPHAPDPERFATMVLENGGTGIVAINSLGPCMTIDAARRNVRISTKGYSWASGPAIKPLALAMVHRIRTAHPEMPIIGVGGVRSAEDVIEFLLAGANAVQMLSSALLFGKDLYQQILTNLPAAMQKFGFNSIADIRKTVLASKPDKGNTDFPIIDAAKCTKCGLCERVCPWFSMKCGLTVVANTETCFSCGLCESRCPVGAISGVL